jgi:hypothetical protein
MVGRTGWSGPAPPWWMIFTLRPATWADRAMIWRKVSRSMCWEQLAVARNPPPDTRFSPNAFQTDVGLHRRRHVLLGRREARRVQDHHVKSLLHPSQMGEGVFLLERGAVGPTVFLGDGAGQDHGGRGGVNPDHAPRARRGRNNGRSPPCDKKHPGHLSPRRSPRRSAGCSAGRGSSRFFALGSGPRP